MADSSDLPHDVTWAGFVVGRQPFAIWARDVLAANRQYLSTFRPDFFAKLTHLHAPGRVLAGDDPDRATALRMWAGLAVETMFAMLCASFQAPHCVFGWMLRYKLANIRDILTCIRDGTPVLSVSEMRPVNWQALSRRIHGYPSPGITEEICDSFATSWARLADEFLKPHFTEEYNAIKHGFRTTPSSVAIREHEDPTSPALLAFETNSYMALEPFATPTDKKGSPPHYNFNVVERAASRDPIRSEALIALASISMNNVVTFLRAYSGEANPGQTTIPEPAFFKMAWEPRNGLVQLNYSERVSVPASKLLSAEDILHMYADNTTPSG